MSFLSGCAGGERLEPTALSFSQVEYERPDGQAVLSGFVDRVDTLDTPDGGYFRVIDYKTGGTPDETPEQLLEKHALQARVYADVLHKAGVEAVTVKFVRVEQANPTIFVEPAEPQVVTYNL